MIFKNIYWCWHLHVVLLSLPVYMFRFRLLLLCIIVAFVPCLVVVCQRQLKSWLIDWMIDWLTTVGKTSTTNPHQVEVMQLKLCDRRTCSNCVVDRRKCGHELFWQHDWLSVSKLQRKIPIFWRYTDFLQHCDICNIPPPTRSAFDNDKCHVTAFRPISEATELVGHIYYGRREEIRRNRLDGFLNKGLQ